jgi:hypothetical protein
MPVKLDLFNGSTGDEVTLGPFDYVQVDPGDSLRCGLGRTADHRAVLDDTEIELILTPDGYVLYDGKRWPYFSVYAAESNARHPPAHPLLPQVLQARSVRGAGVPAPRA